MNGAPSDHFMPFRIPETIAELINRELRHFGPEVQVIAEPGRYLVSDAGYFICRVVGTATRNNQRWMYWDAGVFGADNMPWAEEKGSEEKESEEKSTEKGQAESESPAPSAPRRSRRSR